MKIITSNRTGAFNEAILAVNNQFMAAKNLVYATPKNDGGASYSKACTTCFSSLAYACGLYKAALDSSPASVKKEFEELDTHVKKFITFFVSKFKDSTLSSTLFESTFHTESEVYMQFLDYTERFKDFFNQLFGESTEIVIQFVNGYILGIKLLCGLSGISFDNVPSNTNCICKNWKYFFSDSNEFTISGSFILPQQTMSSSGTAVTEKINTDIYSKLKKRPLSDFGAKLEIIDISGFSS